ncbi:MAG: alpha/beta hydrolase, partial [Bacteroidota bacterium]
SALKEDWPASNLTYEPHPTKRKNIPTLFITGSLDCRTPIEQTEEIMKDFSNPAHVKVENAGHEQAQWDTDVADVIIPAFIRGEKIESTSVTYADIEFIPFTTKSGDHPSLK